MRNKNPTKNRIGRSWLVRLCTVAVALPLAGCKQNSTDTGSEWDQRLAEIERQYTQKGVDPGRMDSAAHVEVKVEGLPEQWESGGRYNLELVLQIDEGWHINANPASEDYLVPSSLALDQGGPVSVVSVDYPEGSPFSIVGFETPISVYEGTVRIPFQVQVNSTLAPGTHTANGRVLVQACDDQTCLAPSRLPLTFAVTIPGGAG